MVLSAAKKLDGRVVSGPAYDATTKKKAPAGATDGYLSCVPLPCCGFAVEEAELAQRAHGLSIDPKLFARRSMRSSAHAAPQQILGESHILRTPQVV